MCGSVCIAILEKRWQWFCKERFCFAMRHRTFSCLCKTEITGAASFTVLVHQGGESWAMMIKGIHSGKNLPKNLSTG